MGVKSTLLDRATEQSRFSPTANKPKGLRSRAYVPGAQACEGNIVGRWPTGQIAGWDCIAERIFGYASAEILNRHISILAPEDRREEWPWIMELVKKGKVIEGLETVRLKKDGTRIPVLLRIAPVFGTEGEIIGASATVKEANGTSISNTQALGKLAGGVAHDFNNVLGAVLGYAQLLLRTSSNKDRRAYLSQIFQAGKQGELLTRQLRALGHGCATDMEVVDLNGPVREFLELTRRTLGAGIEMAMELDARPCLVLTDRILIGDVLTILTSHSREAMPKGGRLTVATAFVSGAELPPILRQGSYVRLSVGDNGPGMNEEARSHVFDPFFFPENHRGGKPGFGLAAVYGMVKQLGGFIFVESEPDCGTAFHMYFPQAV